MKQKCAQKAFEMIQDKKVVGLGGGSTVALLIREISGSGKQVRAVTPSQDTMELCAEYGIPVQALEMTSRIDIAFDGCDEVDLELNALKSCGGIHTREKIMAAMADEYILLADEGKLKEKLEFGFPVTVEVLRPARQYVKNCLEKMGAEVKERRSDQKAGLVISDDGNYLMEAHFPQAEDAKALSDRLDRMPGIAGHSLFCGIAAKAVIVKENGIDIIEKEKS